MKHFPDINHQQAMSDEAPPQTPGITVRKRKTEWPKRPDIFPSLLTPTEAAQYLRLDETGSHTPTSAARTLTYWRDRGELKATKFARRVWFRKEELDRFLIVKTES